MWPCKFIGTFNLSNGYGPLLKGFFAGVLLLCALSGLAAPSTAYAEDLISHRAFYEDRSSQQTFEQIQSQPFQAFSGLINLGFTRSAIWVRVRIEPGAKSLVPWVDLRLQPSFLDEVVAYDPLITGNVPMAVTGDRYPWASDRYQSLNLNVLLPQADVARDIWLRMTTTSTAMLYLTALPLTEVLAVDLTQTLLSSLYLALLGVFVLWGLVEWVRHRDAVMGTLVLSQLIGLLYVTAYLGYLRPLWPSMGSGLTPDVVTSVLILLLTPAAYLFEWRFLREYCPKRWLIGLYPLVLSIYAALLVLYAMGYERLALNINMSFVLLLPILDVATLWSARRSTGLAQEPPVSWRTAMIFYIGLFVGLVAMSLQFLGVLRATALSLYGFLAYCLWTAALLMFMVQLRARRIQQQQTVLEQALRETEVVAASEKRLRKEKEHFLAMLTHELKSPLGVIDMTLGAKNLTQELRQVAEEAVTDINAVLDRCLQTQRIEEGIVQANHEQCDVGAVMADLISRLAAPSVVQLRVETSTGVLTDMTLLKTLLSNLLDNALKYREPDSPVLVRVCSADLGEGPGIIVSVANTPGAAGWPDPEQLFAKYYRSAGAHRVTGSGLGLYLVAQLGEVLGFRVAYVPTERQVIFTVSMPC